MSGDTKRVSFPMFELAGPPCEVEGCKGTLVDTYHVKTEEVFKKCSTCKAEFYRMSAKEKIDAVIRSIERACRGEKDS